MKTNRVPNLTGVDGREHRAMQPTVGQAVETFIRLDMVGKSPQTRHWYRDRLKSLVAFLGPEKALSTVLEVDLEEWIAWLSSRETRYGGRSSRPEENGGLSAYTLKGYVTAAERLFHWLLKKKLVEVDLSADLPEIQTPKIGKRGVSDNATRAILEAAQDSPRDFAIIHFLAATGGRLGGVVRLTLDDLRLDSPEARLRQRATVYEKGEKERTVFLSEQAQAALEGWLSVRPQAKDRHVFLGRALKGEVRGLKESGIYSVVKRLAAKAGVEGPASPHQFRHAFGRRLAESGMNLGILSQVMGHTSSKVTVDHYGQFAVDELQEAYNRASAKK